jgi:succinate dehydrogenase/fumarate reductase flavoprotein subunit
MPQGKLHGNRRMARRRKLMELDRRGFLKGAALLGGVAASSSLVACAAAGSDTSPEATDEVLSQPTTIPGEVKEIDWSWNTPPATPSTDQVVETIEAEIVIVGAGIAGSSAAMYAAEQGVNIHIIEKVGTFGNHRWCTSGFNSKVQQAAGYSWDRTTFLKDVWPITNGFQGRLALYGEWFDESTEYLDWLADLFKREFDIEMKVADASIAGFSDCYNKGQFWNEYNTMLVYGNFPFEDINWMEKMVEYAEKCGAVYHYNTPGEQLIIDDSGRCTGIFARNADDEYVRFNVSKGILLATGDYYRDQEMVQCYAPVLLGCKMDYSEIKNTGDMHKAAIWAGADMDVYAAGDLFPFHTLTNRTDMRPTPEEDPFFTGSQNASWRPAFSSLGACLVTDIGGHRVAPEYGMPFQAMALPTLSSPENSLWSIWSDNVIANLPEGYEERNNFTLNTVAQMEKEIANEVTLKFDSIDDLIAGCGFDAEVFKETVERYEELCAKGEDLDNLKPQQWLISLGSGPYYAAQTGVAITGTRGGLKIDNHMRVLKTDGKHISGLYACGNTAGSFYGNVYPPTIPGSGVGHGQCFSRIAVKDMLGTFGA